MRSDAALSVLNEEQQADLFDWLTTDTYDVVIKRIAQPPPVGFGIKSHINSLYRFYEQRQAALRAHDLAALSAQAGAATLSQRAASHPHREGESPLEPTQNFRPTGEPSSSGSPTGEELRQSSALSPQSCENAQSFFNASQIAFSHSTYRLAHSPLTTATYRALSRTLHQHEDISVKREYLDVARQQLALARERLQFDRAQFEYNAARAALAVLSELIAIDQMTGIDDEAKIWRVRDRLFGAPPGSPSMPKDRCSMVDAQCHSGGFCIRAIRANDLK